jgi:hypothetical protein
MNYNIDAQPVSAGQSWLGFGACASLFQKIGGQQVFLLLPVSPAACFVDGKTKDTQPRDTAVNNMSLC